VDGGGFGGKGEDALFEGEFLGIGHLVAGVGEDLEAVIGERIMGSRDHETGGIGTGFGEPGDTGSGDDPGEVRGDAFAGESGDGLGGEGWSGFAGIHADQGAGGGRVGTNPFAEGAAEGVDGDGVERELASDAANAVGTE
jgi:hypothetical protein